jgi:hypothetical protein
MKTLTTLKLTVAVVAMTSASGFFLAPAFAQESLPGCDTAATKEEDRFLGNSNNPARDGQGGEGATTETQAAPKKCPPERDKPGRNR